MRVLVAGNGRGKMFEPVRVSPSEPPEDRLMLTKSLSRVITKSQHRMMFPGWTEISNLKSFRWSSLPERPRHAVILVHGLQGWAEDFDYVKKVLCDANEEYGADVIVHATKVNRGRTKDGIPAGGERVAKDILKFVKEHGSLEEISVVGFSLGGLYARFAISLLYDVETKKVAGLQPRTFITVASPNLGVRSFGVYRFFHPNLQAPLSKVFAGETGVELFLADKGLSGTTPLLLEMSEDQDGTPFISALKSFERRMLYGNVVNDVMVAYGTAVLDPNHVQVKGKMEPPADAEVIDDDEDNLGCRIWFTSKADEGISGELTAESGHEHVISNRLKALGWQTVGVHFDYLLPIAHNMIVAKMRFELEWVLFTRSGSRAVHHIVQNVLHKEIDSEDPK